MRARRAIVLAGEAYLSRLPKLRRHVIPMTSHIVITEPLPPEIWEQIGWEHRDVAVGFGSTAGYLNHTADGRIAFGAYRSRYPYGSHISDDLDRMEDVFTHARHAARVWFPMLQQVQLHPCLGRRVRRAARPHADDGVQPAARASRWRLATAARVWPPRT